MPEVIPVNDDQWAMIERLEKAAQQFTDQPRLRGDPNAIEAARKLIDRAHELKVPDQAIHGLRIYVNMYDTEMDLPEHLRDLSRITGK